MVRKIERRSGAVEEWKVVIGEWSGGAVILNKRQIKIKMRSQVEDIAKDVTLEGLLKRNNYKKIEIKGMEKMSMSERKEWELAIQHHNNMSECNITII